MFTLFFCKFEAWVEFFFTTIKILRSDGRGESANQKFKDLCAMTGIIHQFTCSYTPSQNGVAERKHKHVLKTLVALLQTASMPLSFWRETILIAVYLINKMPSEFLQGDSPQNRLYHTLLDYHLLRVFGCSCFPWLRPYTDNKLQTGSKKCVFLGYSSN